MLRVTVNAASSASPERVLELAGIDFSPHRAEIWPNVTTRKLDVHARGPGYADVTEGGTAIARYFWERGRYDWSEPGIVRAAVLDSNVLLPGSTFELRVAARDGGCQVEMTVDRRFRRSAAGLTACALNHLGGRLLFGSMLRRALKAVEQTSPSVART